MGQLILRSFGAIAFSLCLTACSGASGDRSSIGSGQDFREVEAPTPTVPTYVTQAPSGELALGGAIASEVREGVERAAQNNSMPLEGDPRTLRLFRNNPFAAQPPARIRARYYRYQFTDRAERRASGAFWTRTCVGEYLPAVSAADLSALPSPLRRKR